MLRALAIWAIIGSSIAFAHSGIILPWDSDELDYASASPDAWKVLDLHVSVFLGVVSFTGLYLWGISGARRRYALSEEPAERWRVISFLSAQVILLVALNGPIHHLSDYYLFSAHMVQHLMLNLLWAPLTVVGLPSWLVEGALRLRPLKVLADWTGGLRVKFLLYNGVLYFWHIPVMYDLAIANHEIHIAEHLSFMATAVIGWVGLLCDAPSLPRRPPMLQLIYLFFMTVPMKLLGAIITLSSSLIYHGYERAPRLWGWTPMDDQVIGGLLMWLPGGIAMWLSMLYVFVRWWDREKAEELRMLPPPSSPEQVGRDL
jgi:putative membrane protein